MKKTLFAFIASIFLLVPGVGDANGLALPRLFLRVLAAPDTAPVRLGRRPASNGTRTAAVQEPESLVQMLDEATRRAHLAVGRVSEIVRVQRLASTQT